MECHGSEEINILIEDIIDNGRMKIGEYMKYIDTAKKRKNIQIDKKWDKKRKGFRLFKIDDVDEDWIRDWCSRNSLPEYICVNEINDMSKDEFISRYGMLDYAIPLRLSIDMDEHSNKTTEEMNEYVRNELPQLRKYRKDRLVNIKKGSKNNDRYKGIENAINLSNKYNHHITKQKPNTYNILIYDNYPNIHITLTESNKILPNNTLDIKKTPYYLYEKDKVSYTKLKSEWGKTFNNNHVNEGDDFIVDAPPPIYYWKTPDGWLYLHDDTKTKDDIVSIHIVNPIDSENMDSENIVVETKKDDEITQFVNECIREPTNPRLRIGIREIMDFYKKWCKTKGIDNKSSKILKDTLNKSGFREDKSKGIDLKGNPGKRGYRIEFNM